MKLPTSRLLIASAGVFLFTGCATNTGDPAKDARGRAANAVLVEAGKVLGKAAVQSLFTAARDEILGGNEDPANAAAHGLWTNMASITLDSSMIKNVIDAYSGANLPTTSATAAYAFSGSNATPSKKAAAIASVISSAAGAPPAK